MTAVKILLLLLAWFVFSFAAGMAMGRIFSWSAQNDDEVPTDAG